MLLVSSSPTEIRQLNIDDLRIELGDLADDPEGIVQPTMFAHTPPLTISGVTLARVVEILDPYTLEFEDGLYNVNIVGGNSNVADVVIKNQVGVNTANSAGLQDPFALQAAAFGGEVSIDASGGLPGTSFPRGTRAFPVNNVADANTIADARGIKSFRILSAMTISSGDFSDGHTFIADNPGITVTLDAAADVTGCEFRNMTITGTLDGGNTLRECAIQSLNLFNGFIFQCGISGTITLNGTNPAVILQSFSLVAGGGPSQYPVIDLGGTVVTPVVIRDWTGGLGFENCSTQSASFSVDFASGRAIFDSTITAGTFTVRGIADVEDNSGVGATVSDLTIQGTVANDVLAGVVDSTGASDVTLGDSMQALYALAAGNVDRSGTDDRDATFYAQDGVTEVIRNRTTDTTRRPF